MAGQLKLVFARKVSFNLSYVVFWEIRISSKIQVCWKFFSKLWTLGSSLASLNMELFTLSTHRGGASAKYMDIAVRSLTCHTATGTHMPYRITQCYLPPDRSVIPAFTPAEDGTRLSDLRGMQGWVDLVGLLHTEMVHPPKDGHPSKY